MRSTEVFDLIPKRDFMSMFFTPNGEPYYEKVVNTLNFKKKEVASAAHVAGPSIRYDHRIPKDLKERIEEWAILLALVAQFFQGDIKKTELWFRLPNSLLGNVPPRDMIRFGRFKKLLTFIQNALREDKAE